MRVVAFKGVAVFTAAVGLTFAGCGDDVTVIDMAIDASQPDLTQNNDLANPPDMAQALATAQLTLADIGGTFYKPGATAGSESPVPYAHLLFAQQSLGMYASHPQYIDSDFSASAGQVHGCTASRYNLATGVIPNPDVDAGLITYTGYNTLLLSADAMTPPNSLYPPPIPAAIHCAWGGAALPFYGCVFGAVNTDMKVGIEGDSPSQVVFPAPYNLQLGPNGCGVSVPCTGTNCPANMTSRTGPFGPGGATITLCEQHPIETGKTLTETVAGGSGYPAVTMAAQTTIPINGTIPDPMNVLTINGTAVVDPTDPLHSDLTTGTTLGGVAFDGSTDLTITWNCDATTMAGHGCGNGITDLTGLLVIAGTNPRYGFKVTPSYGSAQCAEQLGSGTVKLKKEAIAALLGGATTNSVLIALVRLSASPTGSAASHYIYLTGGKGYYGLLNH